MKRNRLKRWTTILACAACLPIASQAIPLTIGSAQRTATLDSATAGATGTGNSLVGNINSEFPLSAPWTLRGNVAGSAGTDGLLTIALTSGSWGSGDAAGTWAIASSFWTLYQNAVIALHVGNGGGDPDHFSFLIQLGQTSGTWSYDLISGGGGGLSNLRLFSSGTASRGGVPDGGSTMVLLGLALAGVGFLRRRIN